MTRRSKVAVAALAVIFLLLAQASWALLSWRGLADTGLELPAERVLLGLAPLAALDALVAAIALLVLRASLGKKRFAFALALAAVPLAVRGVIGADFERRREAELAKAHARVSSEHARLARVVLPTVGSPADDDAAPILRNLTADDRGLAVFARELAAAATAGSPLRVRLARAIDGKKALLEALHEAARCARCDGALLEAGEDRAEVDDGRFERLVQLAIVEGHLHAERGEAAAARDSYLVALRLAIDLAGVRHEPLAGKGQVLEVRALQALFAFATSEAARALDLVAFAKELERFEDAILSPRNAGEIEGLVSLERYLAAPELVGAFSPWDEDALLRAHFFWFLPAACGLVRELPRAERLVQLGDEWAKATDGKTRADVETIADEIERSCAAPACTAFWWRGSAEWTQLALARLVRASAIAEARRSPDGRYPESLGDAAPEDPFAPGQRVVYTAAGDGRSYRVASAGIRTPLVAHETASRPSAPATPLPPGAVAQVDSEGKGVVIVAVAFTKDGASLVVGSGKSVRVLDASGAVRARMEVAARALALDPGGREVLVGETNHVSRWDLESGKERDDLAVAGPGANLNALAFSPDGLDLAVAPGTSEPVRVFGRDGLLRREIPVPPTTSAWTIGYSMDGALLATGGSDTLRVFDVAKGTELFALKPPAGVFSFAFSPDAKKIVMGVQGDTRLMDVASRSPLGILATGKGAPRVAWSPDGKTVGTGGADGVVRLWDVAQLEEIVSFQAHAGRVNAIAFAPDGRTIASGGVDGRVYVWECVRRTR